MTGIYGYFSNNNPLNVDIIEAFATSEEQSSKPGYFQQQLVFDKLVLGIHGNNKLSIKSSDGCTAVIDGALDWKTSKQKTTQSAVSAAEILIHAYKEYGIEFINQISGAYSFALYDSNNEILLIATDRMGISSLYYKLTDNGVIFSSSLNSLLKYPDINPEINPQSIFNYLYFHCIPSPDTIYRDVNKLEPGFCLKCKNGVATLVQYWQPEFRTRVSESNNQLQDELHNVLSRIIKKYSNIKNIGAFLSGGLDSSTVAGVLASQTNSNAKTYSIGFSQEGYDEIQFARTASSHFNTEQHEYYVTPDDVADAIMDIASAYDEPFGNSSAIPTLFCARLAKENGTETLLAGDGGDELFAGNSRYAKQKLFDYYQSIPLLLRNVILEPIFLNSSLPDFIPPARKVRSYIEQAKVKMPERMESYNFLQRSNLSDIFTGDFLSSINTNYPITLLENVYTRSNTDDIVDKMLYLDWKFTLADNDLRKVTRMCELAGVHVLFPMLDDDLVDFSTRVPPNLKLKGLHLRYFYKNAMRGFLPEKIINKSKHGFGLPFGEWLKSSSKLQDIVYSSLDNLSGRNIVKSTFIKELIDTHKVDHASYYGTMIWVLTILELWLEKNESGS